MFLIIFFLFLSLLPMILSKITQCIIACLATALSFFLSSSLLPCSNAQQGFLSSPAETHLTCLWCSRSRLASLLGPSSVPASQKCIQCWALSASQCFMLSHSANYSPEANLLARLPQPRLQKELPRKCITLRPKMQVSNQAEAAGHGVKDQPYERTCLGFFKKPRWILACQKFFAVKWMERPAVQ